MSSSSESSLVAAAAQQLLSSPSSPKLSTASQIVPTSEILIDKTTTLITYSSKKPSTIQLAATLRMIRQLPAGGYTNRDFAGIPASGKRFSIRGCSFGEFQYGKLKRKSDYWDCASLAKQLSEESK